ncbi:MAG: FtsX-like permease family protein, partial [Chloroflexi bacterium]|nr:FtsX-like permease family protein [Chloroflexota bacterium]
MNLFSVFAVSAKRLWNNKGLTVCALVGMTVAVTLIASVPLYSEAANLRVLQRSLDPGRYAQSSGRSPFAFMYRYIGSWHGPVELDETTAMNEYVDRSVAGTLGLPLSAAVRYYATEGLGIFPASDAAYTQLRQPISWMSLAVMSDLAQHITIVDGALPVADPDEPEIIDVLVGETEARTMGLRAGEIYVAFRPASGTVSAKQDKASLETKSLQVPVRIAGIWKPVDPRDDYWFYSVDTLGATLLTSEEIFGERVVPAMPMQIETAVWYLVLNGDSLRVDDVPRILANIVQVNSQMTGLLPGVELHVSPDKALRNFYTTTRSMTVVLYFFSVPILGLVLYFIGLIWGLIVERQRGEIAVLKSRGAGDLQVIGIYLLEGLLVSGLGLVAGLALARVVAMVMGHTVSFLTFQQRAPLNVEISPRSLRLALAGVAVGLAASLAPAIRAARLTIVTYKRERARAMLKPVWQRYYLDVALLIPAGYGY